MLSANEQACREWACAGTLPVAQRVEGGLTVVVLIVDGQVLRVTRTLSGRVSIEV